MTGNRGRGSRFQIWVAVPVSGLVAGAGLAALTFQGLDRARDDRGAVDATDDDGDMVDAVADALRVHIDDEEPGYGTEEPPVEEPTDPPVDPPTDPVDGTATEQTTDTGSEPTPTGASVETVG